MEYSPGLKLYKCFHCRRSFFTASSRQIHCSAVHVAKNPGHGENRVLSVKKILRRYRKSSGKYQSIFKTLLINWPPESALRKICKKHKITPRRAQVFLNRMLSPDYKNSVHGTKCPDSALLSEYSKNKNISKNRAKDISLMTGISCQFVRFWFMWRNLIQYPTWKDQVLHNAFLRQHYPDDETMLGLVADNVFPLPEIRSWFRVARAKSNVLELREVEEKLLWKWLHLHPDSTLEKGELEDVARLVGMSCEDVQSILHFWKNLFDTVEQGLQQKNTNTCNENNPSSTAPPENEATRHSAEVTDSDNVLNNTRTSWKELSDTTFKPYVETEKKKSSVKELDLPEISTDRKKAVVFEERNLEDNVVQDEVLDKSLLVQNHVLQPISSSVSCKGSEDEDRLFVLFNNDFDDEKKEDDATDPNATEFDSSSDLDMEYEGEDENNEDLNLSSDYEVHFVKQIYPTSSEEIIDLTIDDQSNECSDEKQDDGTTVASSYSSRLDIFPESSYGSAMNINLNSTMIQCKNEPNLEEDAYGDDSSPHALRICLSEDEDEETIEVPEIHELKDSLTSLAESFSNISYGSTSIQHSVPSTDISNNTKSLVNTTHKSKRKLNTPKRLVQPHYIKKRKIKTPMHISKSLFAKSWKQCQESSTMAVRRHKTVQMPRPLSESDTSLNKSAGTSKYNYERRNERAEDQKSVTEDLKRVINSLQTWLNNNVSQEES